MRDEHDTTRSSSRKEVFHMTDQTLTTGRSLSEFTAQLASASPAPGGGGAAALAGALAASLGAMAANVTAANPRYADRTGALSAMAAACDAQRTALLALIEADAAGLRHPENRPRARGPARGRGAHGVPGPAGHAGALRADRHAARRRARHHQPAPALGRRVRGGAVPRGGGGRGHERLCQHRPARARRPRRDRGARRASARVHRAPLHADRERGAQAAAGRADPCRTP